MTFSKCVCEVCKMDLELSPVIGFNGFARVRANPFLECRDSQQTRSCFCYRHSAWFFEMRKPVVSAFDTKENLFLKF